MGHVPAFARLALRGVPGVGWIATAWGVLTSPVGRLAVLALATGASLGVAYLKGSEAARAYDAKVAAENAARVAKDEAAAAKKLAADDAPVIADLNKQIADLKGRRPDVENHTHVVTLTKYLPKVIHVHDKPASSGGDVCLSSDDLERLRDYRNQP